MYYVYILRCKGNRLYTGYTTDIVRRYNEHASGKGGKFTRMFPPLEIVYRASFATKSEACREEYRIKQLTKKQKEKLILEQGNSQYIGDDKTAIP